MSANIVRHGASKCIPDPHDDYWQAAFNSPISYLQAWIFGNCRIHLKPIFASRTVHVVRNRFSIYLFLIFVADPPQRYPTKSISGEFEHPSVWKSCTCLKHVGDHFLHKVETILGSSQDHPGIILESFKIVKWPFLARLVSKQIEF